MSQSMTELEQLRSHYKATEDSAAKALAEHEAECQALRDLADKARSELEGSSLIPCRPCSFILRVDDSKLLADFRTRTLAQFIDLEERLKTSRSSLEGLQEAADPMLKIAFPDAYEGGSPPSRLELLKAAPGRLKAHIKEVALVSTDQALALMKSHYPRVDLQQLGEGFTEDVYEAKADSLIKDVRPISDLLVENLDFDSPVE